jgi:hypothetical protein
VTSEAVRACLDFLLDRRSDAGCWIDWELPPGRSSTWTTAYVGLRASELPAPLKAPAAGALRSAARWLQENELAGGGWGYSDRTGCDADSTAHAVLFLSMAGARVPEEAYRHLLRFQQEDGGFSTYGSDDGLGSWGIAHPDVSAVAALAVRPMPGALDRAVEYVLGQRTPDGLWNSFWWSSPLYATRASLALLRAVDASLDLGPTRAALHRTTPANAFERALLLESLHLCDDGAGLADELAAALAEEQLADGSWTSAPVLRITRRTCTAPWRSEDAGQLYADAGRRFTSATVLAALGRHLARSQRDAIRSPMLRGTEATKRASAGDGEHLVALAVRGAEKLRRREAPQNR